jgi:endonuclease/exonuclease/phosphatase family metal-dependent hydrolase
MRDFLHHFGESGLRLPDNGQTRNSLAHVARGTGLMAVLVFVIGPSDCASHRPAQLQLEPPARVSPLRDDEGAQSLRLLSYNIWGLPGWMTGARSGRYPQIARELERLDPDIVLLQEAWTAEARKSAPAPGSWWIARAAGQDTFFQQSGLMTLSKFPIIGGEFHPFSQAALPDRWVNKGVLKTTISLPGGSILNVWNVHLQAGGADAIRRSQVQELVALVQAAEDGQIADLVGGDFNCTPESTLCRELERALGPTVYELGGCKPFVTWNKLCAKPGAGRTLDYIFVREKPALQSVEALTRVAFAGPSPAQRLSDHLGLDAVVKLNISATLVGLADGSLLQPCPMQVAAFPPTSYAARNK